MQKITPWLWFETQAEEAAAFYTGVFPNSRILDVSRYGQAGPGEPGSVLSVTFELDGVQFAALNGGTTFPFNESVSFQVACDSQDEVDTLWTALTDGGQEVQCGWLKDRYGVSWQIVPTRLHELIADPDPERANRAVAAMLEMRKIDIAVLERAADGAVRA